MQMEGQLCAHIAIQESELKELKSYEVRTVLDSLAEYIVKDLLPRFERFFR